MNIITISREFGSGGRELGKRLSDILGYDYYDREIITAIAEKDGLSADYVEKALDNSAWKNIHLTYRRSFASAVSMGAKGSSLLSQQTGVIKEIAKKGRDAVIVGRNADIILKEYKPFNIFVCASMESRAERCMERAESGEKLSRKEIEQNIKNIDKSRKSARELISDSVWGERASYDLTVNTTGWNIKELSFAVAEFAQKWFGRERV